MGQHRREDINGDTKQNCSNRRDLHQNREKMTTRMDKTCDMIVHIIPPNYTHTHKYKHTYIYSFIVMGGEVVRYGSREESQPRTVGLPYAAVDFGISSPLDAGFWIVFPHIYIRNGSHRAVLSTPSHMIESHPHPHIHILYNYCTITVFFRFILFHSSSK